MKKLLLIALALFPALAMAQGFQVNLHGEKQVGMGDTGTGLLQDGASVLFNPGAVAMLPQNYIQGSINPLFFKSAFEATGSNQVYNNSNQVATPFTAYAVWGPKDARWKIGMGVYTPFGGLTNWGNNWPGKYALESLNLKAIYFQPTLSVKLTDYISIGAGFVYNYGSVDLTQALPVANSAGQDGQAELKGNGHGLGWNAGVYIKTESGVTFGFTHRSEVTTKISGGDALFTNVAPSIKANFPDGDQFSSQIPLPSTTSFGMGLYPSDKWTIAFDLEAVQWDVYRSLDFTYTQPVGGASTTSLARNYKDAFDARAGAEYKACSKIALRFGGGFASTAVEDGYVTPEAPDANRVYGTLGFGYKVANHLDLDLAFEYEHVMSRTQTEIQTQLSGTFVTNVYIPGISLAYHW